MKINKSSGLFVDTGAWHAVNVPGDRHHKKASRFYKDGINKYGRLVTTNLVIAETHAGLLRARDRSTALKFLVLLDMSNRVQVIHSTYDLEDAARRILVKFQDQQFSLCDAVSFAVMKELGIRDAFAFDKHFETAGFRRLP